MLTLDRRALVRSAVVGSAVAAFAAKAAAAAIRIVLMSDLPKDDARAEHIAINLDREAGARGARAKYLKLRLSPGAVTSVNSKIGASLDQACLAFGTSWKRRGMWRHEFYPLRRSGQNSANEGCSPIVLSIA